MKIRNPQWSVDAGDTETLQKRTKSFLALWRALRQRDVPESFGQFLEGSLNS
jgi:hypothetical protein